MLNLTDLVPYAPPTIPTIRVHKTYLILNREALKLIGLSNERPYFRILVDKEEMARGRKRLYIMRSDHTGYRIRQRRGRRNAYIESTCLAKSLSANLQGEGVYRICEEVSEQIGDRKCYEIFFKKYEAYQKRSPQ